MTVEKTGRYTNKKNSAEKLNSDSVQTDYMGIKLDRDIYRIRTLSFYQKEGGVYNDLITVLTNLRADANIRLSMAPVKVLNEACRLRDELKDLNPIEFHDAFNNKWDLWGREGFAERLVVFSTIYVLNDYFQDAKPALLIQLELSLIHDTSVFPYFEAIAPNHNKTKHAINIKLLEKQVQDLSKQLEEKEKENWQLKNQKYDDAALHFEEENNALKKMYSDLAMESMQKEIDFKAQIADLEEQCKNKDYEIIRLKTKKVYKPKTEVDKVLNFDNVMAYIESRGSYDYCDQLFKMLDKLARRIVTDEQLSQIDALEAKMIAMSKGLTINNDIHDNTGDIMPGTVNMNK